jgi:hypothetical protein
MGKKWLKLGESVYFCLLRTRTKMAAQNATNANPSKKPRMKLVAFLKMAKSSRKDDMLDANKPVTSSTRPLVNFLFSIL